MNGARLYEGVALCPQRWDEMSCAREDYLAPMLMFITEDGWRQLEDMTREELEFWQGQIDPAARRIHAYWVEQRGGAPKAQFHMPMLPGSAANDEPFVREEPKVPRNNPCPCRSGKKYKKCCGLH